MSRAVSPSFEPNQGRSDALFLDVALGVVLLDVCPQVLNFLFVLDAGEDHLGAGNLGSGILDIIGEGFLVPHDARILVGVGIIESGSAGGMPAVETVELGTDQIGRAWPDLVADRAFLENDGALFDILRRRGPHRGSHEGSGGYQYSDHQGSP